MKDDVLRTTITQLAFKGLLYPLTNPVMRPYSGYFTLRSL
jgi:hypothetical protein